MTEHGSDVEQPAVDGVVLRNRVRREVRRDRLVKVRYGSDELADILRAAANAGLRPSGYVAATALASARKERCPGGASVREMLRELLAARVQVRAYGVNLNQVAAALNSGDREVPVWLSQAIAGADRATSRIDEATQLLMSQLA